MASEEVKDSRVDLTTCSICFETFRVPKHFPCLHSFCEKCVYTYITSTFNRGHTNNGVTCPVCRVFVKKPDEVSVEDWAKSLPVNHLLVSLIDMNEYRTGAKLCNSCARENETESAESWCVNCSEALCKQCVRFHRKNKLCASHKITVIGSEDFSLQEADSFCPEHPDKKLEAYCSDHVVVCCLSCALLRHRKCDNVGSVEDAAKSLRSSAEIKEIEKSLVETKEILDTLLLLRKDNIKEFKNDLHQIKKDVQNTYDEMSDKLEQLRTSSLSEIAAVEKEIESVFEYEIDGLQCKIAATENDLALFHSHMKYASPALLLSSMERLSKQSAYLKSLVRCWINEMKEIRVCFERNETLSNITQMKHLGDIKVEKAKLKNISGLGVDMLTVTPILVMEKDEQDYVQGLAILNDSRILVSKHKGKCIELWDKECKLLSSLSVSGRPYGIKIISETEGMVAVESNMLTSFTIQNNTIKKIRDIKVPVKNDFIFHDGRYFIRSKNEIIVLDSSYNHMRDIPVSESVRYLALRDKTTLCYTVACGNKMYCITLDGSPVFQYSHEKLKDIQGVTLDNAGFIYVCGYGSKNVHQLDHDGKLLRIIFDNLTVNPYCIGFDWNREKAIIAGYTKVLVYDLK